MARPREFDPDKVLADAMKVFWHHGYDAASLPDLLTGMGMTRGSLYKAFQDKKSLFLRVLERYEAEVVQSAVEHLTSGPADGLDRIYAFFDNVVDDVQNGDQRGCLLCSAAAGPAVVDKEISELVHLQLGKMEHALNHALVDSKIYSDASDEERAMMAALLLSLYVGLRVMVRSKASVATLERSTKAVRIIAKPPTIIG